MSLNEEAVRALARALQLTLVKSESKNPFNLGYGRYCLWRSGEFDGPVHNATLAQVQHYLTQQAEVVYQAHQSLKRDHDDC